MNKAKLMVLMAVATTVCHVSIASLVTNGDFEASPFDSGWANTGSTSTSGLTGSGFAADLGAGDTMMQDFVALPAVGLTVFQLDFMLSLGDTGGTQRIRLRGDENSSDYITLKMDSAGLHKYAGTWYNAVPGTYLADTTYHIRVNVFDDSGTPKYNVGVSTDGLTYNTSINMGSFHGVGTTPFETIRFDSGAMTIDEVTVIPEPATLGLLAAFGGGILFIRRRLAI